MQSFMKQRTVNDWLVDLKLLLPQYKPIFNAIGKRHDSVLQELNTLKSHGLPNKCMTNSENTVEIIDTPVHCTINDRVTPAVADAAIDNNFALETDLLAEYIVDKCQSDSHNICDEIVQLQIKYEFLEQQIIILQERVKSN